MNQSRKMDLDKGWIHDLAKGEIHPEAERILGVGKTHDPQQLVEESTVNFLTEMRSAFDEHARIFNGYSEDGRTFSPVKVYSLAQSAADFMVFRNQVKLVVSNSAHGVVQISFAMHASNGLGATTGRTEEGSGAAGKPQELLAQIGPFRDVQWTFQGEKVNAAQVARFYFVEFVRTSRDQKRSRTGNDLLLEQIKALLQEKGLNL